MNYNRRLLAIGTKMEDTAEYTLSLGGETAFTVMKRRTTLSHQTLTPANHSKNKDYDITYRHVCTQ